MKTLIVFACCPLCVRSLIISGYGDGSDIIDPDTFTRHEQIIDPDTLTRHEQIDEDASYVCDGVNFNNAIRRALESGKPTLVGRLSCGAEIDIITKYLAGEPVPPKEKYHVFSGIYPLTNDTMSEYIGIWKDALRSFGPDDFMARMCQWDDTTEIVTRTMCSGTRYNPEFGYCALEPYRYEVPWSKALEGKTVLVIHPFIESIECQMRRRETLFEDPSVLPQMTMKYIQTVQSLGYAQPHASWGESLRYMYKEIDNIGHFDVALVAGGAYAMPLAAYAKNRKNASAVVMGGTSQLLFGLKGKRWDTIPNVANKYYSKAWMYPLSVDTPKDAHLTEGGCYWAEDSTQVLKQCPVFESWGLGARKA